MMILNVAWLLRLRAVSLGSQSEVTFREDTGLLKLTLGQDEVSPLPPLSSLPLFPLCASFTSNFSICLISQSQHAQRIILLLYRTIVSCWYDWSTPHVASTVLFRSRMMSLPHGSKKNPLMPLPVWLLTHPFFSNCDCNRQNFIQRCMYIPSWFFLYNKLFLFAFSLSPSFAGTLTSKTRQ